MTAHPTRRLAKYLPNALDPAQRSLYASITGGRRSNGPQSFALIDENGGLEGPFNAMLLAPALGEALQALGGAIRFGGTIDDRAREIAILVVAQIWASDFEQYAHQAVGRSIGLSDDELEMLRSGNIDALADDRERLVARTAVALAQRHDLSDEEFESARAGLGAEVVFELSTLVGYYAMLALQLRIFGVGPPD